MKEELLFETREDFRRWLDRNGQTSPPVWLVFGKKGAVRTLSAAEALEEALCFGWIDGLIDSTGDDRYRKYFSRRRPVSKWSEKNKKLVEKLTAEGKMTPHGLQMVEHAMRNGMWEKDQSWSVGPQQMEQFGTLVSRNPAAHANYSRMPPSARRQFAGYYFEAKQEETRLRRLEKIIARLERNLKLM